MNNVVRKRLAQSVAALGGVALIAGISLALISPDRQNNLSNSTSLELKVPANVHGAVVSEVSPNSAAYEAGFGKAT